MYKKKNSWYQKFFFYTFVLNQEPVPLIDQLFMYFVLGSWNAWYKINPPFCLPYKLIYNRNSDHYFTLFSSSVSFLICRISWRVDQSKELAPDSFMRNHFAIYSQYLKIKNNFKYKCIKKKILDIRNLVIFKYWKIIFIFRYKKLKFLVKELSTSVM
jgi:hypothetical protein